MAHKSLKGRKKARSAVKHGLKAKKDKNKKQKEAKRAGGKAPQALQDATKGLSKAAKKELRAAALQEKQHLSLYLAGERILLVGEGNFSFARALCRRLGQGQGIYATAYDGEAAVKKKYPDAPECRQEVEEKFGGITLVGVDATRLHKVKEFRGAFQKIVWNFPHIGGGESDMEKNIADHQKLLAGFFSSAVKCLDPDQSCAVHVALKSGEPYKSWKVVQVAKAAAPELEMSTAVNFSLEAWPGYSHRRTAGFDERFSKADSEELAKGAKVYVFTLAPAD